MYSTLSYTVEERVARITMERPERRNALNATMIGELTEAFSAAAADADVRVVILRGAGEAFSAGADLETLQQLQANTYAENEEDSMRLAALFKAIYTHPKVTIAEVQGHALAGGCGLATLTDYTYAVPEALFGYTEVKIGFIPALVAVFLQRKVGGGLARRLFLNAELISAAKASDYGLITAVLDRTLIEAEVATLAQRISTHTSVQSIAATKALLVEVESLPLDEALQLAAQANAHARATEDCKRGIAAFLAKEKISW